MKSRILRPVYDKPSDWESLEKKIKALFRDELYLPLMRELGRKTLKNSPKDLIDALLAGDIRYVEGGFSGSFNAEISKALKSLGAKYSQSLQKWNIPIAGLPMDVKDAVTRVQEYDSALKAKLLRKLSGLESKNIAERFDVTKLFKQVTQRFDKDFNSTVKSITVQPKISAKARETISQKYSENLNLYIQKFSKEQILKLRKTVEEQVLKGNRYEGLAQIIQEAYKISARKAKFLARQETQLLSAQLKETRYADLGIDEYKWKSVVGTETHPVRKIHKELNDESARGKTFRFSHPPITDSKGNRNNPGQDYNCRCVAVPIVKF